MSKPKCPNCNSVLCKMGKEWYCDWCKDLFYTRKKMVRKKVLDTAENIIEKNLSGLKKMAKKQAGEGK